MQVRSVEPRTVAMQLLAKAANAQDSEKEIIKRELVSSAITCAQEKDWQAFSDYATAAFTAGLIKPNELVAEIASAIVDRLDDKTCTKTKTRGECQDTTNEINTAKLRQAKSDRGRDFAIFSAREELLRLAKQGNESLQTLFPRAEKKS